MGRDQWEICWKDYYRTLGVNMTAEPEVVKAAYTALAKKHHPDAGGSTDRMKGINEAYEVLSDPVEKARYDAAHGRWQRWSQAAPDPGQARDFSERRARPGAATAVYETGYPIVPWLPLGWQRAAMVASFPIALVCLFLAPGTAAMAVGAVILAAATYACVKTRFLRRGWQAGIVARVAGGFAIVSSVCVIGTTVLTAVALLAVVVLLFVIGLKVAGKC